MDLIFQLRQAAKMSEVLGNDLHAELLNAAIRRIEQLTEAGRAIVAARYSHGEWQELSDAIGHMTDIVGVPVRK